ncbi:DUF3304 domain-containing protein [Pseudomonas agarici]|uniref:DUF3304 domain-containing protein n=1 Tax=Pseudomonas agarici TaxID=46677 RepID=UPI0015A127FA|nr:DUF3304 domain-containing protein [Pseudomonas agarici]NWC11760.1 DUF3304 domain-containing protein [Pseudomonas agarici]
MNTLKNRGYRLLQAISAVLLITTLVGCGGEEPDKGPEYANITAYNHTSDYIHEFYINGSWGGNSRAYGGGGKFVCCIGYPREWHPDLTATVRWSTSASKPNPYEGETWHEQVVPIERYTELGSTLNVHFLAQTKVRLIISDMGSGHPAYPGPRPPEKPNGWPFMISKEDPK